MLPKRTVTIKDSAAYGVIVTQGYGTLGKQAVSTPSMIRFGEMTEDEVFVTADVAKAGRAHRESQRIRSARHAQAFRARQSGRTTAVTKINLGIGEATQHKHPAIHNAMWPGLVGKGPDSEPFIDLETMLDLTAQAEVDGIRFDGVDLFLSLPHTSIDSTDDELKHLADSIARRNLVVGSLVAPVWPPTGGGSAMGSEQERQSLSHPGKQGLCHRQEAARSWHSPLRRDPH